MMYFKLALKNVKKSVKDYAIYFFTLIIGVSIFYMFNSIDSQVLILELTKTKHEMVEQMTEVLSILSVFVAFVLAFLIIYASRFLMKRRKKEFGIYMLLGMKKSKMSKIILTETFIVGLISLIFGLLIGIGLSQLMSIIVANMFEANMTKFAFTFSMTSLIKTIIYFIIIYVFIMLFNVVSINKCNLIDLINSNRKNEVIKLKNMKLCVLIFILSVVMLGYSYYSVTINQESIDEFSKFLAIIIIGCLSTFLIFWSLSGMILKIVMSMKKLYYKGLNSFVVKQLSSKINTTVFSITVICLMLFVTICIFSSSISLKDSMNKKVENLAPIDILISKTLDMNEADYINSLEDKKAAKKMIDESKYTISETLQKNGININEKFKDIVSFNIYSTEQITLGDILGTTKQEALQGNPSLEMEQAQTLIKISDYNKIAQVLGKEQYKLKDNEYIIIADYEYMTKIMNAGLSTNPIISINQKEYYPKYKECKNATLDIEAGETNPGIIILPDDAISEDMRSVNKFYANYRANTKEEKQEIEEEITSECEKINNMYVFTRQYLADSNIGFGAMAVFLGLYLGITFLISSGAILALKELSESIDNKNRYDTLRKLGVSEKIINKTLFKQIGIFFLFPLILAIIHSIPGIQVSGTMIAGFGKGNLFVSIILTAIFIVLIYGGYFLVSYYMSKRIISKN